MGLSRAAACSLQFIVLVGLLAVHTQGRLRSAASLAGDVTASEGEAPMERNWGGRHDLTDVTTELGADIARRWGEVTDELLLEEALGVELPTVALVEEEESGNGTNHTPANLTTVDCDNKTKSKGKKNY